MSELLRDGNALTEQDKTDIRNGIGLGTAATLNVPSSGNATSGQVVKGDDTRLTDSREWTAATVDQTEAEDGTATTRRAWTAQRVRQAISAWWAASAGSLLKTINGNSLLGSGDLTIGGGGGATNLSYTASATGGTVSSDTGTDATLPLSDGTNAGLVAPAQHSKLAGIAAGATANSSDATLLNRANHTGTQAAATISDSTEAGRALLTAADAAAQRSALGLGTAATTAATAYATAAQGTTADGAAQKSANLSDLASASTARTNLGVASAGAVTGSGLTMATARLLGRSTASTGAVEEITVGSGLTLSAGTLSASGGGGTPGGSSGQPQWNNGGVFAGMSGSSWNDSTQTLAVKNVSLASGGELVAPYITVYQAGGMVLLGVASPGASYAAPFAASTTVASIHSGSSLCFRTGPAHNWPTNVALSSVATNELQVNNGTNGTLRDLKLRSLIQQPPSSVTPASNGDLLFEATSNTTITVKLKGSDGTVRTGSITLS